MGSRRTCRTFAGISRARLCAVVQSLQRTPRDWLRRNNHLDSQVLAFNQLVGTSESSTAHQFLIGSQKFSPNQQSEYRSFAGVRPTADTVRDVQQLLKLACRMVRRNVMVGMAQQNFPRFSRNTCGPKSPAERVLEFMDALLPFRPSRQTRLTPCVSPCRFVHTVQRSGFAFRPLPAFVSLPLLSIRKDPFWMKTRCPSITDQATSPHLRRDLTVNGFLAMPHTGKRSVCEPCSTGRVIP